MDIFRVIRLYEEAMTAIEYQQSMINIGNEIDHAPIVAIIKELKEELANA